MKNTLRDCEATWITKQSNLTLVKGYCPLTIPFTLARGQRGGAASLAGVWGSASAYRYSFCIPTTRSASEIFFSKASSP